MSIGRKSKVFSKRKRGRKELTLKVCFASLKTLNCMLSINEGCVYK